MLKSSTPDGLAPIGSIALLIFIGTIGGLSMIWGIVNLYLLIRVEPEGEKTDKVTVLHRKMLKAAIGIMKINMAVGLAASVLFFLIILGAIQNFQPFYSLGYACGALNSIIIATASLGVSCFTMPRVVNHGRLSLFEAHEVAKKAANFQSYFFIGQTILAMGLFLVMYERSNMIILQNPSQIQKIAKTLICFSFGSTTISISSRIVNSIYSKGAEFATEALNIAKDRLRKDSKHPALIARALGELFNKTLSIVLDSTAYLAAGVAVPIYIAGCNIIGVDQKGQIYFDYSLSNCYLPILSFLFSLFYNLLFNLLTHFFIKPYLSEEVRTGLNIQRYATAILLCGFQALAAYLCLPAQFFVHQMGRIVKYPYHAYLAILFGVLLCTVFSTISQIYTTHPYFVNPLSRSCKISPANNIIHGLSSGYFFNSLPIIFITAAVFLSQYWIGTYGIGLVAVGYLSLLPHYLYGQLLYSYLDNASFISCISQLDEGVTQNLVDSAKTHKDYQPHIVSFLYGFVCCFGFQMVLTFIEASHLSEIPSLITPKLFFGLLLGAMTPYLFNGCLIRSIYRSGPAIIYDINLQTEEIPSMVDGVIDPDSVRTSNLFVFQCLLSFKRFIPVLIGPIILIGIAGGPILMVGFICGVVLSGVQLGWSSGMSGCAWSTLQRQMGYNNLKDEDGNQIKADSNWGRAANIGNFVGQNLKDCVSPSISIMIIYWSLQNVVLAQMYNNIHLN